MSSPTEALSYSLSSLNDIQLAETDLLLERCVELQCDCIGTVHAIAFWFQLHMLPASNNSDLVINTGPNLSSFSSSTSHWRQAAILLDVPLSIERLGQMVKVRVSLSLSFGVDCKIVT